MLPLKNMVQGSEEVDLVLVVTRRLPLEPSFHDISTPCQELDFCLASVSFIKCHCPLRVHSLQESDLIRLKREAKAKSGFYVPPEAKVIFVIRIRGINDMHPKV